VLRRGLALARSTGQELWLVPLTATLARAELCRGRVPAASELARVATDSAACLESEQLLAWSESVRCLVLTASGASGLAIASGERACLALSRVPGAAIGWLPHCALGAALIEAGEPARGLAMIVGNAGGHELTRVAPAFRSHWWGVLAGAELAQGRVERADDWLSRAGAQVARFPLRGRVAALRLARAECLRARGESEPAAILAHEAAQAFRAQDQPVDAGRALLVAGEAQARAGRADDGRRLLLEARELTVACGAGPLRERADRALDRLAAGAERGTLASLSARERQVADLVASGITNRQIADELVVTQKTVERHLSRIFAKLGLTSRAALAVAVERARWSETP
jgi:ATP/maltotriose-dependent transcriptional regulator MalT